MDPRAAAHDALDALLDAVEAAGRVESAAPPALLDIPVAAARLNLSRTTLYGLLDRPGGIRSVRAGRRRLIPEAAIRDFLDAPMA